MGASCSLACAADVRAPSSFRVILQRGSSASPATRGCWESRSTSKSSRKPSRKPARRSPGRGQAPAAKGLRSCLNIQLLYLARALHDEPEAGADVLAEQIVDGPFRLQSCMLRNGDLERDPAPRIEGGGLQLLRRHLAEALEPHDVRLRVALRVLLQDARPIDVVERPERVLADLDLVERRLRQEDGAVADQVAHVAVEEREQQRRD